MSYSNLNLGGLQVNFASNLGLGSCLANGVNPVAINLSSPVTQGLGWEYLACPGAFSVNTASGDPAGGITSQAGVVVNGAIPAANPPRGVYQTGAGVFQYVGVANDNSQYSILLVPTQNIGVIATTGKYN